MEFEELKKILRRLYKEYVQFHIKTILFCLFLSILVAGSTSSIAWLLTQQKKKIFLKGSNFGLANTNCNCFRFHY